MVITERVRWLHDGEIHQRITTKWQYNGVDKFSTILAWCYLHLDVKDWDTNNMETIYFNNEQACTMFLLRWA